MLEAFQLEITKLKKGNLQLPKAFCPTICELGSEARVDEVKEKPITLAILYCLFEIGLSLYKISSIFEMNSGWPGMKFLPSELI